MRGKIAAWQRAKIDVLAIADDFVRVAVNDEVGVVFKFVDL